MLNSLRNAAGTWVAKALLVVLVASFGVWGISGSLVQGLNSTDVLTAGQTNVSISDYRLAYDRQMRVESQRYGQRLTREQARLLGVDQTVLEQLTAGVILDEQAREMQLGLSKDRLAALTAEDPAFKGPSGNFDRATFDMVLRNIGMRPEDYLNNRQQVAIRQQIVEGISDGIEIPDTFLKAYSLYSGEDRTVEFLVLSPSLIGEIKNPDDEVLTKWFDENIKNYAAPEYRKFTYVSLTPEAIADPKGIDAQEIKQDYVNRIAQYKTQETRDIQQLLFKDETQAQTALDSLRDGSTFDDLITAQGKTPQEVSLGTVKEADIGDEAIRDAAFKLRENEVSKIVKGAFGPVLLRVVSITPETTTPLEEVQDQIRNDMAIAAANTVLLDMHDQYEDARAGGATMSEAAKKLGLEMKTVDNISRTGLSPDDKKIEDLPSAPQLIDGVFKSSQGLENPPLDLGRAGFVWYEVEEVTPTRDRTLDEVREQAITDWKAQELQTRLALKAQELRKRVSEGTDLATIAAELGIEKQTKYGLKRNNEDPDLGRAGVETAFSVVKGATALAPGPNNETQILFVVTDVVEPAGAGAQAVDEKTSDNFTRGFADDLLDQMVVKLRDKYSVTVNRNALEQALSF